MRSKSPPLLGGVLRGPRLGPFLAVLLVAASIWNCGGSSEERSRRAPEGALNVVVVLSDALRASNLELYGYPRVTAPNLTALSRESVVFADHLANYPGTPVSVSQMMTGRLMAPLLMRPTLVMAPVRAVEPDLLVLPAALQEAGYRTGIVSSHPWFEESPILRWFDETVLVKPGRGEAYAPFGELLPPVSEFLDRAGEPFFLYVHSMDTHDPFRFHEGFDRHRGAEGWPGAYNLYDSEIEYTDHGVGRILDALRERDLLERTIFVFTSDHGEELGEMGIPYWNRSHGYTLRRVQLHVPLLIRLPGARLGGEVRDTPSRHLDLAPTLLRLALPDASLERFRLDGRDLGPDLGTGGSEDSTEPPPVRASYTWRYWALHDGDLELHWDQWSDETELYRTERARFNYPLSAEVEDPETETRMAGALRRIRRQRTREFLGMPPVREMPDGVVVGTPTTVLSRREKGPTYHPSPVDGLWHHDPSRRLEAGPGEDPGPVTLGTAWAPGRYRIRVRLARDRLDEGWENRFRISFPLAGGSAVEVDGGRASLDGTVDLGVHEIGPFFAVEIASPRGGVSIVGFSFESPSGDRHGGVLEGLEETRERLEALGYVD